MAGTAPLIPGCRDVSLIGERVARSLFTATSDRVGPVTVTVFPPLSGGNTREQFDRAAATAQRLGAHPSVVTIHEWGHAPDGRPWVVTAPQPAESVDTLLTMDGPLEVERALQVGVLLAGALETAHRAGIVHGDLSPSRLVFGTHGEPLLAETGLAPFAVLPGLGALNNPVRYHAPPEVLERTSISTATDVYSLATTVYALIAGRAPQQKPAEITDSNASLLLRILQMPVPRIARSGLPPGLEEALRGPLSPSPHKRPQQAIEMAWLLQDAQRRAGFAVTEPVVLDLDVSRSDPVPGLPLPTALTPWPDDEPEGAPQPGAAARGLTEPTGNPGPAAPALPAAAALPAAPPLPAPPVPPPPPGAPVRPPMRPPGAPPLPAVAPLPAVPQAPGVAASAAPATAAAQVEEPLPEEMFAFGEPDPPSPTVFPFGDEPNGLGIPPHSEEAAPTAPPAEPSVTPTPAEPAPWSLPDAGAGQAAPLWPSTWPSDTDRASDGGEAPWQETGSPSPPAHMAAPTTDAPEAPSTDDAFAAMDAEADTPWTPEDIGRADTTWTADSTGQADTTWATESTGQTDTTWSADPVEPPAPTSWAGPPAEAPAAADDAADPVGGPDAPTPGPGSLWPARGGSVDDGRSLWPSTWPADADKSDTATPAWAAPPPAADAPDATTSREGSAGDGGSIGDAGPLPSTSGPGNGLHPGVDLPFFPPVTPPPELDELPAWYTDPLPNAPRSPFGGGGPAAWDGGPGRPGGPPAPDRGALGPGANGNGNGNGNGAYPGPPGPGRFPMPRNGANGDGSAPGSALAPWHPGGGLPPSDIERLPGAGDELRSLFGEVVRDPADEQPPAARPAPPTQVRPLADPLGPPDARPPIDLAALDTPLGPAPFLGTRDATAGPPAAKGAPRLPSRHEADARQAAGRSGAATVTRLPRAGEVAPGEAGMGGAGTSGAGTAPAGTGAAAAGPPALPLIILIAVVAVLVAGVAWLVLTGDDGAPPASERDPAAEDGATAGEGGAPADGTAPAGGAATGAPTAVQAVGGPDGVQVSWQGAGDAFTVTVLTPDQPPSPVAATGTSVLVPTASFGTSGSWCVTVAATPAGSPAGPASAPVCSDGATIDGMRGA